MAIIASIHFHHATYAVKLEAAEYNQSCSDHCEAALVRPAVTCLAHRQQLLREERVKGGRFEFKSINPRC